jgi:hypothetical protein
MKPRKARQIRPEAAGPPPAESPKPGNGVKPLVLKLDSSKHAAADLESLKAILLAHPGDVPVIFEIATQGGPVKLEAGSEFRIEQTKNLVQALLGWMS